MEIADVLEEAQVMVADEELLKVFGLEKPCGYVPGSHHRNEGAYGP